MKIQKVVRTYTPEIGYWEDSERRKDLIEALEAGYRVVMCNTIRRKDGQEWLEYILEKEDDNKTEKSYEKGRADAIDECIAEINRTCNCREDAVVYPHTICNILEMLKEKK